MHLKRIQVPHSNSYLFWQQKEFNLDSSDQASSSIKSY